MGSFSIKGNGLKGANSTLVAIMKAAAERSPYDIVLFSGDRDGGKGSRHDAGMAVDVVLIDPSTGQAVPNLASRTGFPIYEQYAKLVREEQMRIAPAMSDQLRWGGYFSPSFLNPKGVDLMHFDFKPGGKMAGGSWENGANEKQLAAIAKMGNGWLYNDEYRGEAGKYPGGFSVANLWTNPPAENLIADAMTFDQRLTNPNISTVVPAVSHPASSNDPELDLMARMALAEARGEGDDGMAAILQVARNRALLSSSDMAKEKRWPDTIGEQFTENPREWAPLWRGPSSSPEYQRAYQIAAQVRDGTYPDLGVGTYFKTPAAKASWAKTEPFIKTIGGHQFYGRTAPETQTADASNILQMLGIVSPAAAAEAETIGGSLIKAAADPSRLLSPELGGKNARSASPASPSGDFSTIGGGVFDVAALNPAREPEIPTYARTDEWGLPPESDRLANQNYPPVPAPQPTWHKPAEAATIGEAISSGGLAAPPPGGTVEPGASPTPVPTLPGSTVSMNQIPGSAPILGSGLVPPPAKSDVDLGMNAALDTLDWTGADRGVFSDIPGLRQSETQFDPMSVPATEEPSIPGVVFQPQPARIGDSVVTPPRAPPVQPEYTPPPGMNFGAAYSRNLPSLSKVSAPFKAIEKLLTGGGGMISDAFHKLGIGGRVPTVGDLVNTKSGGADYNSTQGGSQYQWTRGTDPSTGSNVLTWNAGGRTHTIVTDRNGNDLYSVS